LFTNGKVTKKGLVIYLFRLLDSRMTPLYRGDPTVCLVITKTCENIDISEV